MSRLSEKTFYEQKNKTSGKVPEKYLWSVGNITMIIGYFTIF